MFDQYACPSCGTHPPDFDGTYYRIEHKDPVFDLSVWDLEETKQPVPDNYWPKISKYRPFNTQSNYGHEWEEIHKCPNCGKEFSFINSDI